MFFIQFNLNQFLTIKLAALSVSKRAINKQKSVPNQMTEAEKQETTVRRSTSLISQQQQQQDFEPSHSPPSPTSIPIQAHSQPIPRVPSLSIPTIREFPPSFVIFHFLKFIYEFEILIWKKIQF